MRGFVVLGAALLLAACGGSPPPSRASVPRKTLSTPASTTSGAPSAAPALGWRRLTPPRSLGAPLARALAFSPGTIIAAGVKLERSTDGGRSWRVAMDGILEQRPAFQGIAFTGARWLALTENELYASDDDGSSWSAVGLPGVPAQEGDSTRAWRWMKWHEGSVYLASRSMNLESRDEGRTWAGLSSPTPSTSIERLALTKAGVWRYANDAGAGKLHVLRRGANKWQVANAPTRHDRGEQVGFFGAVGGALYVTLSNQMLLSKDEGRSWKRVKYTGDAPAGSLRELWELPDAALGADGVALYRVTGAGVTTKVYDGRVRALATSGNEVVALTATHLVRSKDAGRTFTEERPRGLGSDWVSDLSANGRELAVVAHGPTAFVSDDAGKTWSPGPDLGAVSDGVVAGNGAFLFHASVRGAHGLWRATSAAGPWMRVPLPAGVSGSIALLGAEGSTIAIANGLTGYLTLDAGQRWLSLGPWPLPSYLGRGLVRGSELLFGGPDGMVRSHGGSPFEDMTRHFFLVPPRRLPDVLSFFHERDTTYALAAEGVYAWERTRDMSAELTLRLMLGPSTGFRIEAGAVHGTRILVSISSPALPRLMLSPDLGKTWLEVKPPLEDKMLGPLARTDTGFVLAQGGLWTEAPE